MLFGWTNQGAKDRRWMLHSSKDGRKSLYLEDMKKRQHLKSLDVDRRQNYISVLNNILLCWLNQTDHQIQADVSVLNEELWYYTKKRRVWTELAWHRTDTVGYSPLKFYSYPHVIKTNPDISLFFNVRASNSVKASLAAETFYMLVLSYVTN